MDCCVALAVTPDVPGDTDDVDDDAEDGGGVSRDVDVGK